MIGDLPQSLIVGGVEYKIKSDFRDILDILEAFDDPNLKEGEKIYVCLAILYEDFEKMPKDLYNDAYKEAIKFIDHGQESKNAIKSPKVMDWEQDEAIIFSAVNKVAGFETRSADYIHWWTFLGYYMEITDGIFARVVSIRSKKSRGKKLEKWEREFAQANSSLVKLKRKISDEEREIMDRINAKIKGG